MERYVNILGHIIPVAPIAMDATSLALAQTILDAKMMANAADGLHAYQSGGTYGHLHAALEECLVIGLLGPKNMSFGHSELDESRVVARTILELVIDSGESVAYCLNYANERVEEALAVGEREECEHGFNVQSRCPLGCGEEVEVSCGNPSPTCEEHGGRCD